jgi:hypothetical protein
VYQSRGISAAKHALIIIIINNNNINNTELIVVILMCFERKGNLKQWDIEGLSWNFCNTGALKHIQVIIQTARKVMQMGMSTRQTHSLLVLGPTFVV